MQLTIGTPPWPVIHAAGLVGHVVMPATVDPTSGISLSDIEPLVPTTGSKNLTVTLTFGGAATLYYTTSSSQSWMTVYPMAGMVKGGSSLTLLLQIDGTAISTAVNYRTSTTLTLTNALTSTSVVSKTLSVVLEGSGNRPGIPQPACYNGVVQPSVDGSVPTCACFPGAYGQACEFLLCPKNCTGNGVCNSRTGVCHCLDNYFGIDCSGHRGGCYFGYDGKSCKDGYTAGTYAINAEDDGNINRGTGALPDSMQCSGGKLAEGNPFGCSTTVEIDLCCKAPTALSCPFDAGSTPCVSAACASGTCCQRGVGVLHEGDNASPTRKASFLFVPAGDFTNGTCLSIVQQYCFFTPQDAACRAFGSLAPPSGFCPIALAVDYCSQPTNWFSSECSNVINQAHFSCGFQSGTGSPCSDSTNCPAGSFNSPSISSACLVGPASFVALRPDGSRKPAPTMATTALADLDPELVHQQHANRPRVLALGLRGLPLCGGLGPLRERCVPGRHVQPVPVQQGHHGLLRRRWILGPRVPPPGAGRLELADLPQPRG